MFCHVLELVGQVVDGFLAPLPHTSLCSLVRHHGELQFFPHPAQLTLSLLVDLNLTAEKVCNVMVRVR